MHSTLLLVSAALALSAGADDALKPWSTNTHPTDVAKSRVEEITTGLHKYTVLQGGTMDGRSCRLPMGCGIAREGAFASFRTRGFFATSAWVTPAPM